MSDRKAKLNPTLALALQARAAARPAADRQDEPARPAVFLSAADYRRLARSGKDALSTGIPTVCTIH